MTATPVPAAEELKLSVVLATLAERWRFIVFGTAGICAIVAVILLLFVPRKYLASTTLATVSSGMLAPNGLAASLLQAASQGGFNPTPALVASLFTMPSVLRHVAETPTPDGRTVLQRLTDDPHPQLEENDLLRLMRGLETTRVDRETGLLQVTVAYKDSALARFVTQRLVEEVRQSFVNTAKAQASQLRIAQAVRVDSAARQLHRAEDSLAAFTSANRTLAPFSLAQVTQQRLERAVQIAQQVYLQAENDLQSAIAMELENTPAVVVVDSMPQQLPAVPRRRVMKLILTAVLALLLLSFWVLGDAAIRRQAQQDDPDLARLRRALEGLPWVGRRLARRLASRPPS